MSNDPQTYQVTHPTNGVWTQVASPAQLLAQLETPVLLPQEPAPRSTERFSLAVKANIGVAGFTRSAGCRALEGRSEEADSPVVAALRAAGAVVVGMSNMHELAFGITSENTSYGAVRQPADLSRSAGGSSGGSAAAVAEGAAEMALGTDTGGSVSIPASVCGVFGFRPTTSRWPTEGIVGLSWTRDTPGIFARTVDDLMIADRAVTGAPEDLPVEGPVRLGVPKQLVADLDPHTAEAFERALSRCGDHLVLEEVDLNPVLEFTRAAEAVVVGWESKRLLGAVAADAFGTSPQEGFARLVGEVASPDVAAILSRELREPITAAAYAQAHSQVLLARHRYAQILQRQRVEALVFPTTPAPAPPLGAAGTVTHLHQSVDAFQLYTRNTAPGTMLATPMVTLPVPMHDQQPPSLPVGLTVQGQRFADRRALRIAELITALIEAQSVAAPAGGTGKPDGGQPQSSAQ